MSSDMGSDISFSNPPLIEVVCGVQFGAPNFSSIHFGLYWNQIRERFEKIPDDKSPLSTKEFKVLGLPPLRRVWFESLSTGGLIQLQEDYFLYNWRKRGENDVYPRFESIYPVFLEEWKIFREWYIGETQNGFFVPTQYQLAYVNEINIDHGWQPRNAGSVFNFLNDQWTNNFPFELGPQQYNLQFKMPEKSGSLSVEIREVYKQPEVKPVLLLEIVAKSSPDLDIELVPGGSLNDWFHSAHASIVDLFVRLTRMDIQEKRWNRLS